MTQADALLRDLRGVYGGRGVCAWCHREHDRYWFRPMDVGGRSGSHHTASLTRLVQHGAVLRRVRGGHCRPAYMYRRSGLELCPRAREKAVRDDD